MSSASFDFMSMSMSKVKGTYYIENKMLQQGCQGYRLRGLLNEICPSHQDEYLCIVEELLTLTQRTFEPIVTVGLEGFSFQLMALSSLLKEI